MSIEDWWNPRSLLYYIMKYVLEGARESAYLRQVNFYRRPFRKILRDEVCTVPGNMRVKFEVRIFNHFGAICI